MAIANETAQTNSHDHVDHHYVDHHAKVPTGSSPMDLTIWLPALFFAALAVLGLMFGFVVACDKV
jgi:hypothetical protein